MAFSLTIKEVDYWTNRLNRSYENLRFRVRQAYTEEDVSFDEVKDMYFEVLQKKINDQLSRINSENWSRFNIDVYAPSMDNFSVLSSNERCTKIREICSPFNDNRHYYTQLLISKPTEEQFREIVAFVKEMDNFVIEKYIGITKGKVIYHE